MIQPPRGGELREHLGSTQKVLATQNFIKDKMTGRVDILWPIFKKIAKKLRIKSQERKTSFLVDLSENVLKILKMFFWSCDLNYKFFVLFLKMR